MRRTYQYAVHGTAAHDQTWSMSGTVVCEWHEVFELVMRESFRGLTGGKAIYGKPGVGCTGPYDIREFHIEEKMQ